jgi:hypothetical protein
MVESREKRQEQLASGLKEKVPGVLAEKHPRA